jgi:thiamine phosphate synthase YjbQ (UPF0047 family)
VKELSTHKLRVRSRGREELVEFTEEVRRCLRAPPTRAGVCVLFVRHTVGACVERVQRAVEVVARGARRLVSDELLKV